MTDAELISELTDALVNMAHQHCGPMDSRDVSSLDSNALSANADAMRLLARLGKIEITNEYGKRVIGKWVRP